MSREQIDRPRLLAVGPALDQSSYARVLESTLGQMTATWDIRQIAVNHSGAAADIGWLVFPNAAIGDRYAIAQTSALAADFAPAAILVLNGFLALPRYWDLPARLGQNLPALVAQCPMLGEASDPRLVARLGFFDCVVVLSEIVRAHMADCFETCVGLGIIDRTPRLEVIPHGLDSNLFHPLRDRAAARAAIPALRDMADDGFVVLNANRNLPRKRIETTLAGFAAFARGKPDNVRLYLHMGETQGGLSLRRLAVELGVSDRVIIASDVPGVHPSLSDADLNTLYNACDVGINTAASEGFGMVSFEHAATEAAQIVSSAWVCGDIWRDAAECLAPSMRQPPAGRYTREVDVSVDAVEAALTRLYEQPAYRTAMARRAADRARAPDYQWRQIAASWDRLLRDIVDTAES